MDIWWDALEGDAVLFEGFLEFVGALIVNDVEFGGIFVRLELVVEACPGAGQFASLASLERFGKNDVAVVVVQDQPSRNCSCAKIVRGTCLSGRSMIFVVWPLFVLLRRRHSFVGCLAPGRG